MGIENSIEGLRSNAEFSDDIFKHAEFELAKIEKAMAETDNFDESVKLAGYTIPESSSLGGSGINLDAYDDLNDDTKLLKKTSYTEKNRKEVSKVKQLSENASKAEIVSAIIEQEEKDIARVEGKRADDTVRDVIGKNLGQSFGGNIDKKKERQLGGLGISFDEQGKRQLAVNEKTGKTVLRETQAEIVEIEDLKEEDPEKYRELKQEYIEKLAQRMSGQERPDEESIAAATRAYESLNGSSELLEEEAKAEQQIAFAKANPDKALDFYRASEAGDEAEMARLIGELDDNDPLKQELLELQSERQRSARVSARVQREQEQRERARRRSRGLDGLYVVDEYSDPEDHAAFLEQQLDGIDVDMQALLRKQPIRVTPDELQIGLPDVSVNVRVPFKPKENVRVLAGEIPYRDTGREGDFGAALLTENWRRNVPNLLVELDDREQRQVQFLAHGFVPRTGVPARENADRFVRVLESIGLLQGNSIHEKLEKFGLTQASDQDWIRFSNQLFELDDTSSGLLNEAVVQRLADEWKSAGRIELYDADTVREMMA